MPAGYLCPRPECYGVMRLLHNLPSCPVDAQDRCTSVLACYPWWHFYRRCPMSANTFTLTCIGADAGALSNLHAHLQAAIGVASGAWAEPLNGMFADWDQPSVLSASLLGTTLRCQSARPCASSEGSKSLVML
eukprot:gene29918-37050_t